MSLLPPAPPSVMEQGLLPGVGSHKLCDNLLASSLQQAPPVGPQRLSAKERGPLHGGPNVASAARGRYSRHPGLEQFPIPRDTLGLS